MTEYKPLEEIMPRLKILFEESFKAIQTEQNAGFLVCENNEKNLAIGGVCKGDCYSAKLDCPGNYNTPGGWKRRIAVLAHYQM